MVEVISVVLFQYNSIASNNVENLPYGLLSIAESSSQRYPSQVFMSTSLSEACQKYSLGSFMIAFWLLNVLPR